MDDLWTLTHAHDWSYGTLTYNGYNISKYISQMTKFQPFTKFKPLLCGLAWTLEKDKKDKLKPLNKIKAIVCRN